MSRTWKVPSRSKEELFANAYRDGSIERWARAGATDKQIAENIGVSRDTFYKYLREYPDVLDTLQHARRPVVHEAFEGLVRLSKGYHEKKTSKHIRIVYGQDKNGKRVETGRIEEIYEDDVYVPPSHQACTKVIVNYLNQTRKSKDGGVPDEYITEPAPELSVKQGRLPELEKAMQELFYGGEDENQ